MKPLRNLRVLLIEDDPDDYLLTADAAGDVSDAKIELVWTEDPASGVERAASDAFDAILLDYELGTTTGLDVMEQLRALQLDTPVVFLTGYSDPAIGQMVVRRGADEYLFKQEMNPVTLQRSIHHAIERREYVERIEQREALHSAVLASLHEGVMAFDASGVVTNANDRAARLLGVPLDQLVGSKEPLVRWRVTDAESKDVHSDGLPWTDVVAGSRMAAERVIGLWDGSTLQSWLSVKVQTWTTPSGIVQGAVASLADVTEDKRVRDMLQFKAFHDALTGLPNRELFYDRLEQSLKLLRRSDSRGIAVLFLDLDHFKAINDTWGHAAGDQVLKTVAERIGGQLRDHDTLARLGGDEFVILLREIDRDGEIVRVVERICSALATPIDLGEGSVVPEVSVGIALQFRGDANADDLLERADRALYDAKRSGRNTYRFCNQVRAAS